MLAHAVTEQDVGRVDGLEHKAVVESMQVRSAHEVAYVPPSRAVVNHSVCESEYGLTLSPY